MTVNDTDKFPRQPSLVRSYHLEAQNLMAELQDDDLMLVNRSGKSYKATGAEIKGSLKPPAEVIKPQILAPLNGAGSEFIPSTDVITAYGLEVDNAAEIKDASRLEATGAPDKINCPDNNPCSILDSSNYDIFFSTLNYYNENTDESVLQATHSVWQYGFYKDPSNDNYQKANNSMSPTSGNQRAFIRETGYADLEFKVADTFLIYSGDNFGKNVRKAKVTFTSAVGSFTEEISPANSEFSRLKFEITTPGIVRIEPASSYVLYFYALDFDTQRERDTINLASGEGLSDFKKFDHINQDDGAVSGIISTIDYDNFKIYLKTTTGAWSTGRRVLGVPQAGPGTAPDPSGVNFVGSTFASSDGSLTAGSADWQVTTLADTGYSSIVSEVEKHPDMTDPQPKWTSGALEGETEYRARTKYYAATGEESAWSDDVTFKTKGGGNEGYRSATPGHVYNLKKSGGFAVVGDKISIPGDVKIVAVANGKGPSVNYLAIYLGVDGFAYTTEEYYDVNVTKNTKSWHRSCFCVARIQC